MKILNFGSANIDYIYELNHFVQPGETIKSNIMKKNAGGKGLNQSIAISNAGLKVYHAGYVGANDGEFLLDTLKKYHVDCEYIKSINDVSGHAIIQVSKTGENCIILCSGANNMIEKDYINSVFSNFDNGDYCVLQNEINNIEHIITKAHEKNMHIMFNPSPFCEKILSYPLQYVEYLILNEVEASQITKNNNIKDMIVKLSNMFTNMKIILTLGQNGVVYHYKDTQYCCGIYSTNVVDTTAAGDTFTGYFLSSIIKNISIEDCLKIASAAAAITVSKKGAAQTIPIFSDVEEFMKNNKLNKFNFNLD